MIGAESFVFVHLLVYLGAQSHPTPTLLHEFLQLVFAQEPGRLTPRRQVVVSGRHL